MVSRIGPPAGSLYRFAPKPPPSKAGDIPCQSDMDNFINACVKGDNEEIRWFLKYYPRQWGVHCKGKIGLMFAAENGREHTVKLLLELNSEINAVDSLGMTALLFAAETGREKIVSQLIEKGARMDAEAQEGWTALHIAAMPGHAKTIAVLLAQAPGMIDRRTKGDVTALWLAAVNGREETVRLLLDHGASLGKDDKEYHALMQEAHNSSHANVVKMLKEEPQRRKVLLEAEIDEATEKGLRKAFRIKGPMKLLKQKHEEKLAEEPANKKKEAFNAPRQAQQGAAAKGPSRA
jgi:uncharacterized protein